MRTLAVALLALCACGPETEPPPEEETPPASSEAAYTSSEGANGASVGVWYNYVTCGGSPATTGGSFASDMGWNMPALLGTLPAACRPPAGNYDIRCSSGGDVVIATYNCPRLESGAYAPWCTISDGTYACRISVNAAGQVTLVSPAPGWGMTVWPRF